VDVDRSLELGLLTVVVEIVNDNTTSGCDDGTSSVMPADTPRTSSHRPASLSTLPHQYPTAP
jgi:hypothetical protein